eukprot:IDg4888t1
MLEAYGGLLTGDIPPAYVARYAEKHGLFYLPEYTDSGYNARAFLEVPFQGASLSNPQTAFNTSMSGARVTVEWMYMEVKLYWTSVDFKRKMRVFQSPWRLIYRGALLLTNFRNCEYPNTVSQYFKCKPPSLEEYLTHRAAGHLDPASI